MSEGDRIGPGEAAKILGCSLRTLQIQSARGKVPSAARVFDTHWSYDPVVLRRHVKQKEEEACQTTSIGAAKYGGADFSAAGPSIDEAYGRLIRGKRESASRRGEKKSRTRPSMERPGIHIVKP